MDQNTKNGINTATNLCAMEASCDIVSFKKKSFHWAAQLWTMPMGFVHNKDTEEARPAIIIQDWHACHLLAGRWEDIYDPAMLSAGATKHVDKTETGRGSFHVAW